MHEWHRCEIILKDKFPSSKIDLRTKLAWIFTKNFCWKVWNPVVFRTFFIGCWLGAERIFSVEDTGRLFKLIAGLIIMGFTLVLIREIFNYRVCMKIICGMSLFLIVRLLFLHKEYIAAYFLNVNKVTRIWMASFPSRRMSVE